MSTQALQSDHPFYVISTMRADFNGDLKHYRQLTDLLNQKGHRYLLPDIDQHGLRDAIVTPSRLTGFTFGNDVQLREDIIKEVVDRPLALPLMGNLMQYLWQKAKVNGAYQRSHYSEIGGAAGALAARADDLLNSLKENKHHGLNLLCELVRDGENSANTKRAISRDHAVKAAGGGGAGERVLRVLSGGTDGIESTNEVLRLISINPIDSTPTALHEDSSEKGRAQLEEPGASTIQTEQPQAYEVELAHEALLQNDIDGEPVWPIYQQEITKTRKHRIDRARRDAAAQRWHNVGAPRWGSRLARGADLTEYIAAGEPLPDTSARFVRRSRHQRNAIRGLVTCVALAACLLLSYLLTAHIIIEIQDKRSETVMLKPVGEPGEGVEVVKAYGTGSQLDAPGYETSKFDVSIYAENLDNEFHIGTYEVTFAEFDQFSISGESDSGWGRGTQPVINVSWHAASAYVRWLGEQTGDRYHLPSESQWEYVARAGTETKYWWGDELVTGKANCDGCGSEWDKQRTAPVGSFDPNPDPFGIYDTAGNVWEWVQDCWHSDYTNAPVDGSAWLEENEGNCDVRVVRGGSWLGDPVRLRSANRDWVFPGGRSGTLGFRVARTP